MVLAFAAAGLMMIGNNVFANENEPDPIEYDDNDDDGDGAGGTLCVCYWQIVDLKGEHRTCLSCKLERGTAKLTSKGKCKC